MKLSEQFALRDLDDNAISAITAKYLFDREHGGGFNRMHVDNARLHDDKLCVQYKSDPTYEEVGTAIDLNGRPYTTKAYDTVFEFQSATDYLGDLQTLASFNDAERASLVRDYIDHGLARVWCNCPAYYYQSHWEAMDAHGSAVFPFPGPRGKGIWKARHAPGLTQSGISICKHIAACIHEIDNDIQSIAKVLIS